MSKNDGNQAFPSAHFQDDELQGMSLRDYFAAKVLSAWIIAAPTLNGEDKGHRDHLSALAYAQADSMLAERAK